MMKRSGIVSCVLTAAILTSVVSVSVSAGTDNPKVRIVVSNTTNDSAPWSGNLVDEWVDLKSDSTATDLFIDVMNEKGLSQTGAQTGYVTEIGGLSAEGMGGWMFGYNDWYGNNGIGSFKTEDGSLSDGDELCFAYSMNWGVDIGSDFYNTSTKLLKIEYSSDGNTYSVPLTDETEYSIELPEGTQLLNIRPTAENKNYRYKIYKNEYTPDEPNDIKASKDISVNDGDSIYIGVGHDSWHSWMPDGVTETVYKLAVSIPQVQKSSEPSKVSEPEQSDVSQNSDVSEQSSQPEKTDISVEQMLREISDNMSASNYDAVGFEWENMVMARLGKINDNNREKYLETVKKYIADNPLERPTDFAKYTIVLTAMGQDAENFDGTNLVEKLTDTEFTGQYGINGTIYALIALDSKPYLKNDAKVRNTLVSSLLEAQLEDGGWTFFGDNYDVDMTAMTIKALAPYYLDNKDVKTAVDKALELLSAVQQDNGTFCGFDGSQNCDSTAEVVTALSALMIDADKDERFVKANGSALDGLKSFYDNHGFSHIAGDGCNKYSTAEGFMALCAYDRIAKNLTRLYDMSDVFENDKPQQSSTKESSLSSEVSAKASSQTSSSTAVSTVVSSSTADTVKTSDNGITAMKWAFIVMMGAGILVFILYRQKKNAE